jgi:hypothetical protein
MRFFLTHKLTATKKQNNGHYQLKVWGFCGILSYSDDRTDAEDTEKLVAFIVVVLLQENLVPHKFCMNWWLLLQMQITLVGEKWLDSFVNGDFRRSLNEVFILLGCYATLMVCYRRFGTTYCAHLQDSGRSPLIDLWRWYFHAVLTLW